MSRERQVVVPLGLQSGSDGDPTHRPPAGSTYVSVDPPTLYLQRLATWWMRDRGEDRAGVSYILERLPVGYACYQRSRPNDPTTWDKFLYGHPAGKLFDSPNRFYPHFKHLMDYGGDPIGCPCKVCSRRGGLLPKRGNASDASTAGSSTSSQNHNRIVVKSEPQELQKNLVVQPVTTIKTDTTGAEAYPVHSNMGQTDEEGTPDVFRSLIDRLKHGALDVEIREPLSMDWRAEQAILPDLLHKVRCQPQWVPRVGDVVLFIRHLPDNLEIFYDPETSRYGLFDAAARTLIGFPAWEAGLVGQTVPGESSEQIVQSIENPESVSLSGIRVEPLPSPNGRNKKLSKQYVYVSAYQTRPFFLWSEYLGGLSDTDWHPTIKNALTIMSTMAVMGKHRFRGQWPSAQIYSHGIYVGSEFLAVGDTVRLLPKAGGNICTDFLVIKSIRLKLSGLDEASNNDYDDGRPYNSEVWVYGPAYTIDSTRLNAAWPSLEQVSGPRSSQGYGTLYPLHSIDKELAVPFSRLLGRLHEADVMQSWLPSTAPNLDQGRASLLQARHFARANDKRISSAFDATWYWADSRSEALALQTVNGLEVGRFDSDRDPSGWRRQAKIIDGVADAHARHELQSARTGHRDLRAFMAPTTTALPMRNMSHASQGSDEGDYRQQMASHGVSRGLDRAEIKRAMRVLSENELPAIQKKQARVTIVID